MHHYGQQSQLHHQKKTRTLTILLAIIVECHAASVTGTVSAPKWRYHRHDGLKGSKVKKDVSSLVPMVVAPMVVVTVVKIHI